jgi:hypothetical protein
VENGEKPFGNVRCGEWKIVYREGKYPQVKNGKLFMMLTFEENVENWGMKNGKI